MKTLVHLLFQAMRPQRNRLIRGGGFTAVALLAVTAAGQPAPPNDMFTNATVMTGLITTVTGSNRGATKEPGEPGHAGYAGGTSVWWTWTAPTDGNVVVSTIGSSFDTLLAVYTGSSVASLAGVTSNDDSGGNGTSKLAFGALAGTVYQIAVDGYNGASGDIVLNLWQGPLPPQITTQPQSMAVVGGANVEFGVGATGGTPLRYQWYKDGIAITGVVGNYHQIGNVQTNDAGAYTVVLTNAVGSVTSSIAVLTVNTVVITNQPLSLTLAAGYNATFNIGAAGLPPIAYQWRKDGLEITGATNTSYAIVNVEPNHAGAYSVVVSNPVGRVISSNADLAVIVPYTFSTFAGQVRSSGTNDGAGGAARFNLPHGVAVDSAGNVYVAEDGNHAIRRITPDGVVSTFAGLAGTSGTNDGLGSVARFFRPWGVAVESGNNVYVADAGNHTIRKITPDGTVSTLAGSAGQPGSADGPTSAARFYLPSSLAVDSSGNVYVADTENSTIRKITPDGMVTTLAGRPYCCNTLRDGPGSAARFFEPSGVAVDHAGNIYVADGGNNAIRKITPDGVVTTLAGRPYRAPRFFDPHGGAVDNAGNFYVADHDCPAKFGLTLVSMR